MAVGRCYHGLSLHWHRPETDTGDVHCGNRERWSKRRCGKSAANRGEREACLT